MINQNSAFDIQHSLIDPRCPWVEHHPAPPGPAWRLVRFAYDAPEESGGNHHIYVHLLDADGLPAGGIKVTHGWPDHDHPDETVTVRTNPEGNVNWAMWEDSCIDSRHPRGPYWIQPCEPADLVDGMGLPSKHHVNYRFTFQWGDIESAEPPVEGGGATTDLWSTVREHAKDVPAAHFLIIPHAGHTYRVSRIGDGGLAAVEIERPGIICLVLNPEFTRS